MLTGMGSQNRNQLEIHMEKNKDLDDFFFFFACWHVSKTNKQTKGGWWEMLQCAIEE